MIFRRLFLFLPTPPHIDTATIRGYNSKHNKMDQETLQIIDYVYAVLCRVCKSKVLDPDKKKNQIYLDGRCPSCGEQSIVPKTKKQRKKERKAQERAFNLALRQGLISL